MDEIFELVRKQIEKSGYGGKLSAGVVLTGGAAASAWPSAPVGPGDRGKAVRGRIASASR